jgi:transcriptional regulator with XRE-family HTH domain
MAAAGRKKRGRRGKLSAAQIREIRHASGERRIDLARRFGVSVTLICHIISGQRYGDVPC